MNIVLCNCPPDSAAQLARTLVERRLCACVNILPGVRSLYVWDGRVCDDVEATLLIKTTSVGVDALREALVELHPYEVPEVLVLPVDVTRSHPAYLAWVRDVVG